MVCSALRLSGSYLAVRIADPFTPGAGVQPAVPQTGGIQRQEQMTGCYTGAAHGDGVFGWVTFENGREFFLEYGRTEHVPILRQNFRKRQVEGSGHVTGYRVDRLLDAPKSGAAARIEKQRPGV